jgi:hypothetical protein
MSAVTARAQRPGAPPHPSRWRALLVLGLLAGLLGMHGLAPAGTSHGHGEARHRTAAVGTMSAVGTVHDGCSADGACGGGHLRHADPTCMSGAVSGGPTLPALVPDPVAVPVPADVVCSYAATAPDGGRAPPSLAELQLLRI